MSRRVTKKLAYQQYKERCYIHLSQVWDNNKNMTYFFIYTVPLINQEWGHYREISD